MAPERGDDALFDVDDAPAALRLWLDKRQTRRGRLQRRNNRDRPVLGAFLFDVLPGGGNCVSVQPNPALANVPPRRPRRDPAAQSVLIKLDVVENERAHLSAAEARGLL